MTDDQIARYNLCLRQRGFDAAFDACAEAIRDDGTDWNAIYLAGLCLRFQGDYDGAIGYYQRALRLAPDEAPILVNLGVAYQLAGDYPRAITSLERAIALNPTSANIYNSLGYTHRLAGRFDDAIAAYDSGFDAHAASIYMTLNNSPSSRIFKHRDVMGEIWMKKALKAALNAAVREPGVDSIAIPDGESAVREEKTEAHEGLYYVDMDHDGKHVRLLLPNYFNTFRERLRSDLLTAVFLNNLGSAFLSLDDRTTARARFIESIQFIPSGTDYPPPYDGLRQCEVE